MKYQTLGKDISLILNVAPNINTAVIGDQNRVRQVLVNLISNAVKFTDKGSVSVAVNSLKHIDGHGIFEVIVADTGIGIEADKIGSIFEKFSQIDSIYQRKYSGIGLGLSITKELVHNMGGEISVTSVFGKGSAFRFTLQLPLQNNAIDSVQMLGAEPSIESKFEMKILLVEDNPINQKIASIMLEELGCKVDVVSNGREVLDKKERLLDYDLIFMDVGLPDMSGFDIASEIRRQPELNNLPIIAMTAHILERDRKQAVLAGMDGMVAKPISYDRIREMLARYN
jgi:CheY-like chemotaxis protein